MTMKLIAGIRTLAAGTALGALVCMGFGAPALAQKPTNSAKLAKPLKAAEESIKEHKYAAAIAKLKDAENISGKTPYDQHLIDEMLSFAYIKTQNLAEADKALEAEVNDGFTAQSDIPQKIKILAEINYQLKNYDKAIDYGNRAIKGGYADENLRTLVGQAYYLKSDWKGTLRFENALVDGQIRNGQAPKNQSLQLILSACVKLDDQACETRALEKLVAYYPKPDYWYQLLYAIRKDAQGDTDTLQTYRLMSEVDVLRSPSDYGEMADLALELGSPGEAEQILEKGLGNDIFTEPRIKAKNERMLAAAKKQAVSDQASLSKAEQQANAAPTGKGNVGVGLAYLGYGQYDKAAEQLSKGLTKGGLKNEADARLLLGIAQLKAGHKNEAVKSFHQVKGDPTLERLANLWTLHARQA